MLEIVIYYDDKRGNLEGTVTLVEEILQEEKIKYHLQSYSSSLKMLENCKKADIALLDMAMDKENSIELGKELRQLFPEVRLIYTYTAKYEQYCIQAINEIHACSFLYKPIDKKELKKQLLDLTGMVLSSEDLKSIRFHNVTNENGIKLPYMVLKLNDIVYMESLKVDRKVSIVHVGGQFTCFRIMDELAKELEKEGFAVNARGQLVNLRHVMALKGYELYLDNGVHLQISKKRIKEFRKQINDFVNKKL